MNVRRFRRIENIVVYLFLAVVYIVVLFPILWTFLTSIKNPTETFLIPPVWMFKPTVENYLDAFGKKPFFFYMMNSAILTISATGLATLFGSLAGYSFARFRFFSKDFLFFGILSTRMVPVIAILIPLYVQFWNWGLLDSYLAMILVYTARTVGYATWQMHAFFQSIPKDLDESAMIDGCSRLGALIRVVLPLSLPGVISFVILNLIYLWNDFIVATILTGRNTKTVTVAIAGFITYLNIQWGSAAAASTIVMLPMMVLVISLQKYIVSGLLAGAVKG